uniref:hypothetical protein n=1 Tax=Vibrio cholerae TaxID=666 RepID=UPI003F586C73
MGLTVIIPGVVPHFFVGAAAGVLVTPLVVAVVQSWGFCPRLTDYFPTCIPDASVGDFGFANTTFSDADFGAVGILLGLIVR